MGDNFDDDLDEALRKIDSAEGMSLFFPTFRKAVVIDTRHDDVEGPMVRILPMAASPQERLRSIRRLRSNFPRLNSLALIPWTRYVDSLVTLGVWDRIVRRFDDQGFVEAVNACGEILEELRRLERAELTSAVLGKNYHTIWSASQ